MIGLSILFVATTVYAFGESYAILFVARSLQGVGSAFADTAGLAMIADRYREDAERTKALGIAQAFISFGCLVAPPFGGVLYQFAGKVVPFLFLSSMCFIDGVLLLFVTKPVRKERELMPKEDRPKGTPIYRLLMDPYILIAAGALAMSNVSLAFLEPTIALWMEGTMDASEWEIGFVWLPAFLPYIGGVYLTVKLARSYPKYQWLITTVGLVIEDLRYVSVYGSVYAIADISYSLAYALGPVMAGQIVQAIGFTWLNVAIFLSNVLYAPLMLMLRTIYKYKTFENECDVLVSDPPIKQYHTYMQNGEISGGKGKEVGNVIGENHLTWGRSDSYKENGFSHSGNAEIDYFEAKDQEPFSFYSRR
ncbi:hypothetical protein FSP39_014410 [Pinctada imbricata]|uniref:Major facilitator superfamily (MFS) profile domain-containing protein n=1 Tax=Pinctada imbricata TaxID=66713 RepID=A0AA89BQY1_PINIB|nr:hypothetical protein FSP39_014410 [Pinctada imbricata]